MWIMQYQMSLIIITNNSKSLTYRGSKIAEKFWSTQLQ